MLEEKNIYIYIYILKGVCRLGHAKSVFTLGHEKYIIKWYDCRDIYLYSLTYWVVASLLTILGHRFAKNTYEAAQCAYWFIFEFHTLPTFSCTAGIREEHPGRNVCRWWWPHVDVDIVSEKSGLVVDFAATGGLGKVTKQAKPACTCANISGLVIDFATSPVRTGNSFFALLLTFNVLKYSL